MKPEEIEKAIQAAEAAVISIKRQDKKTEPEITTVKATRTTKTK